MGSIYTFYFSSWWIWTWLLPKTYGSPNFLNLAFASNSYLHCWFMKCWVWLCDKCWAGTHGTKTVKVGLSPWWSCSIGECRKNCSRGNFIVMGDILFYVVLFLQSLSLNMLFLRVSQRNGVFLIWWFQRLLFSHILEDHTVGDSIIRTWNFFNFRIFVLFLPIEKWRKKQANFGIFFIL